MAVGDVSKLIVRLSFQGNEFRPGMHFEHTLADQPLTSLISAWRGSVETEMLACMSAQCFVTGYEVQDKKPGTASSVEVIVTPPVAGTAIGDMLPPQDAIVFSFKSALKTRRARGRVYWPGASEDQHTGGVLTASGQLPWDTFRTAILADFVGTTPPSAFRLVTWSPEDLTPPPPPPAFKERPGEVVTPVSTITLDPTIRSQRRRQLGRGQ
jgi:hypothetical protein